MARRPQRRSGVRGLLNRIDAYRARSAARSARRGADQAARAAAGVREGVELARRYPEARRALTQGQGTELAWARAGAAQAERGARNARAARDRIRRRNRR